VVGDRWSEGGVVRKGGNTKIADSLARNAQRYAPLSIAKWTRWLIRIFAKLIFVINVVIRAFGVSARRRERERERERERKDERSIISDNLITLRLIQGACESAFRLGMSLNLYYELDSCLNLICDFFLFLIEL